MSRRRRPRRRASHPPAGREPVEAGIGSGGGPSGDGDARPRGLFTRGLRAPSPFPPLGASLARGLLAVAGSPLLLATPLALALLLWLGLILLGLDHVPRVLANVLAIPPISSFFDLNIGVTIYGLSGGALTFTVGATVVRSVAWAALAGMIVEAVEGGRVSTAGGLRGLRALPSVLLGNFLALAALLVGQLVLPAFLGPTIGGLGFTVALVAGLYFLVFVPASAIREGRPARETVRRSARAALLPGPRHMLMVFTYFVVSLPVLVGFAPDGGVITANPSLLLWAYVLIGTLVHVVFFAGFTYRWVAVEGQVPERPLRTRR